MIYSFIALSESIDKKSGEGNAKLEKQSSAVARRRRSPPSVAASFLRQSKVSRSHIKHAEQRFFSEDV